MNRFLEIKPGFYIGISMAILLLPIRWLVAWIIAVIWHELGHYVVIRMCDSPVAAVVFSANGIELHTEALQGKKGLLCALSGPLFSLSLLLLARVAPRLALCGLVQLLYNLLPVYPLDGGRAIRCLVRSQKLQCLIDRSVLLVLLGISFYAMLCLDLGFLPVIAVLALFLKNGKIKIPCKQWLQGVQ